MEVHHHPDLHHKKKNFKEYFLEFLMIFLAVTLGFFAESLREHIAEKNEEKDYITGLLQNISDDTTNLKNLINDTRFEKGIDSFTMVSKDNFQSLAVQDSLYYFSLIYFRDANDFEQNDFTIIQLRNAGGYRLIKKDHVADSIAVYEARNNDVKGQGSFYINAFSSRLQFFNETFDWKAANKFIREYRSTSKIPSDIPVLITNDKQKIGLYYNECYELAFIYQGYKNMLKNHLAYLIRFMAFLKKEYDIK
ncbi:MAG: hypothetical protein ACR2FN_01805 [Chitinophagaceae bacterium]